MKLFSRCSSQPELLIDMTQPLDLSQKTSRMVKSPSCPSFSSVSSSSLSLQERTLVVKQTPDLLSLSLYSSYAHSKFKACSQHHVDQLTELYSELDIINLKIKEIRLASPQVILELKEEDVPSEITNVFIRKYLVIFFNHLKKNNALHIFKLPKDQVYSLKNGKLEVHEKLQELTNTYLSDVGKIGYFYCFNAIMYSLKSLEKSNLNDLHSYVLQERKASLEKRINYFKKNCEHDLYDFVVQLKILKKSPQDFTPGNFEFISDSISKRMLSNAYRLIEEANLWSFFDIPPPEDQWYCSFCLKYPNVQKVLDAMEELDHHSGSSMDFTLFNMRSIRQNGWQKYVEAYMASYRPKQV